MKNPVVLDQMVAFSVTENQKQEGLKQLVAKSRQDDSISKNLKSLKSEINFIKYN